MDLRKYTKAIVPVIVAIIVGALGTTGVTPEMSFQDSITLLVTAGLVYLVPNK